MVSINCSSNYNNSIKFSLTLQLVNCHLWNIVLMYRYHPSLYLSSDVSITWTKQKIVWKTNSTQCIRSWRHIWKNWVFLSRYRYRNQTYSYAEHFTESDFGDVVDENQPENLFTYLQESRTYDKLLKKLDFFQSYRNKAIELVDGWNFKLGK